MRKPAKHARSTRVEPAPLRLSPEHLQDFRYRHAALQMADQQARMVREGYQLFLSRILPQYGMVEADIDLVSGEIIAKPKGAK